MKNFNTLLWLSCLLFTGLCLSLGSCGSDNESTDYRVRSDLALVDSNEDDNMSTEDVDEFDDLLVFEEIDIIREYLFNTSGSEILYVSKDTSFSYKLKKVPS